jgi:GntR family transcriptional regulator
MSEPSELRTPRALNRNGSQALFSQLEEMIRDEVESGRWAPGQAIPSERELSRIHDLNRMTVRRALDRLVSAGLLYRVDGKGTFVSEPKVSFKALSLAGLREQALQMGHSASSKLLSIEKVFSTEKIAGVLKIPSDAPAFLIERVAYADDVPLALNRSYIPCHICPTLLDDDLVNQSLYAILRSKYEIRMNRAVETLESALATNRESLLLGVQPGDPMLLLRITVFDGEDRPIEYVKVVFRGDRVQLSLNV